MGPPAFRALLPYLLRYRRPFALGLGCVVVTTAVSLTAPWVLRYAVDDLTVGVTRQKLALYSALLLAIAIVSGCFRFLMRRIIVGVSRHLEYDLRNDFFVHLERLPLAYFQAHRTGDLMSRATNDLNAVRMMIGPAVMYTTNTGIVFIVALILMTSLDAWLTLVALIPLPFVSISVHLFGKAIHTRFERIQAQLSDLSAVAQEALSGVRVVRAYRQEGTEIARFKQANDEYVERNRQLVMLQGFFYPSMGLFLGLGSLLVLWLGSQEVIRGRITLGEFVAFNSYLAMLSWPMIAFGWVTNILQRGMASWKRMLQVLSAEPTIVDLPAKAGSHEESGSHEDSSLVASGSSLAASGFSRATRSVSKSADGADARRKISGAIEFRNLTFTYPTGSTPALEGISLRIDPGQTVALVGATGSGKSTLISLLPRLHEPPAGTVLVDGVDIRDIPLAVLRKAIGFVPQEPFLFSDTIAENIAFGLRADGTPDGRERIERAGAVARLDKDLPSFPKGYDSMVGERGITLSGGQKQRTALARAIAIEPAILILDDALSAVDTYTEEEILSRLRGVMRQRTSIIVSHRISTVRDADRIFVLDRGRIAERGRHDELIERGGVYAALYSKQLLEEELAAT
ncbi:MAG: ABC transporter ATP-binding protein [Acidobacteria bacterium]|nr:ABC transporter ATP-binding protein [Acidobacteriota bacterium]